MNIIDTFHQHYYNSNVWYKDTRWLGIPVQKTPTDLWIYQELLYELKPSIIVETGTAFGGSTLFLASICDLLNNGIIISIDTNPRTGRPAHRRIRYLTGSSSDPTIIETIKYLTKNAATVMVILDSDHSRKHVLTELDCYAPLVTNGSYLIVEDTNLNGHPVVPTFGEGPWEAVQEWLTNHPEYQIDRSREKFFLTSNPNGYLRKSQS
jgi:cephalosporin hydroxylase